VLAATLARGHAANHLGAIFDGLLAVEGTLQSEIRSTRQMRIARRVERNIRQQKMYLLAGEALANDLGVLVDQDARLGGSSIQTPGRERRSGSGSASAEEGGAVASHSLSNACSGAAGIKTRKRGRTTAKGQISWLGMCGTEYITFQIHFFNVFAVFHSGLLCGQNRQRAQEGLGATVPAVQEKSGTKAVGGP
jgi:hypothetical protein